MKDLPPAENQVHNVTNFQDLVSTPFHGEINAICWKRELRGDFSEIITKLEAKENITVLDQEDLLELQLSEEGRLARIGTPLHLFRLARCGEGGIALLLAGVERGFLGALGVVIGEQVQRLFPHLRRPG